MIKKTAAVYQRVSPGPLSLFLGLGLALGQASAPAATSVTLAWNPSISPNVAGYHLYYGGQSGAYTNRISTVNLTNAVVTGLVAGRTYYFAATAYDSVGLESPQSNEASYALPLPVPNLTPTLNAISNRSFNENAGLQTVSLSGISSGATNENQPLTVTAVSSNPSLIPAPTVTYTSPNTVGTLSLAPALNANGTATITVQVNDGQPLNNTVSRSFTVTVNPVNQPPTLNSISNYTVAKNAGAQTVLLSGISSGAANEIQTLKVTAASGNRKLASPPTVVYSSPGGTGSLIFKPMTNATGTTTFTVTVNDGARSNNIIQKTFTVTIANSVQPQIAAVAQTLIAPMVQSMPATLQPVAPVNGMFTLAVEGSTGLTYVVQASSDLTQWESVQTNQAPFTYTDEQAGQFAQRFYRTVSAP